MWRSGLLDPGEVKRLKAARERLDLAPLAVHDNYLINLASADPVLQERLIEAFRREIERTLAIGAEYLVAHPGNYRGQSLEQGLRTLVESLARAARGIKGKGLTLLLENTVGAGAMLGGSFEELKVIRELAARFLGFEIGFCLDLAHCLASGYDLATPEGLRATVRRAESILGLDNVKVIHANDSKSALGSHVDRHQHIGEGYIGAEGFRRILAQRRLRGKPFILETPREKDDDDRRNVERLKNLCRRRTTTTTGSR